MQETKLFTPKMDLALNSCIMPGQKILAEKSRHKKNLTDKEGCHSKLYLDPKRTIPQKEKRKTKPIGRELGAARTKVCCAHHGDSEAGITWSVILFSLLCIK